MRSTARERLNDGWAWRGQSRIRPGLAGQPAVEPPAAGGVGDHPAGALELEERLVEAAGRERELEREWPLFMAVIVRMDERREVRREDDHVRSHAERVLDVAAQHRGHEEGGAPADDLGEAEPANGQGCGKRGGARQWRALHAARACSG